MEKITEQGFAEFLASKPLYYKVQVVKNLTQYDNSAYLDLNGFTDKPFKFLCPQENEIQTFRTSILDSEYLGLVGLLGKDVYNLPYTFDKETRKLDLKMHLQGICQSCKHRIDFLIRATSDKEWDRRTEGINIFIQKIGQFPPYDIGLNKNLKKYLSPEDQSNYSKALNCLSISYGIGSYAYLRRIIENEIIRIIKDISDLDFDGVKLVKEAYKTYQKDSQMSKLIEILNKHIPMSLQELGDNPIKLLYEQLSGGIHEFTDEECLKKASSIDILINYVIKVINEEKYHLKEVKGALNNLRRNNS